MSSSRVGASSMSGRGADAGGDDVGMVEVAQEAGHEVVRAVADQITFADHRLHRAQAAAQRRRRLDRGVEGRGVPRRLAAGGEAGDADAGGVHAVQIGQEGDRLERFHDDVAHLAAATRPHAIGLADPPLPVVARSAAARRQRQGHEAAARKLACPAVQGTSFRVPCGVGGGGSAPRRRPCCPAGRGWRAGPRGAVRRGAGLGRQTAIGAVSSRALRKRPRVTRTSSLMTGSSHVAEGASGSVSMPSSSISVPRTRSGSAGRGRYGGSERIRSLTSGIGSVSCTAGIPCPKRAYDGTVDSGARASTGPRADVRGKVNAE